MSSILHNDRNSARLVCKNILLLSILISIAGCAQLSHKPYEEEDTAPKDNNYDDKVPINEELANFLKDRNILTITLVDSSGELRIVDRNGQTVPPCAQIDGTKIVPLNEECVFKGNVTNINSLEIFVIENRVDPLCRAGGYVWPC